MVRVKWVYPKERPDEPGGVQGFVEGKSIILFKGRADSLTEEHERAHIILRHHGSKKISAQRYIRDEIEAFLYTYKRMKKPRRLITDLRGIIVSLDEVWEISYKDGVELVTREFRRVKGIPLVWKSDLSRIKAELS